MPRRAWVLESLHGVEAGKPKQACADRSQSSAHGRAAARVIRRTLPSHDGSVRSRTAGSSRANATAFMRARRSGESALLLLDAIDVLRLVKAPYAVVGAMAASVHGV